MMTMMSTTGLMVTSQMGAFTRDFGMADVLVFGLPLLPLALSLDRITNGATRPFFGWVSDRYRPREHDAHRVCAGRHGDDAVAAHARASRRCSCCCPGVVFFGWGEIFSLFPSTLTDTFGTKHATANYGCLYMAQGVGSVLGGPVAALLHDVDRLVDPGLRGHHRDGLHDCCARDWGAQADAAALAGGRSHYLSRRDRSPGRPTTVGTHP